LEARCIKVADKTSNLHDLVRCPPPWKLSSVKGYAEHAVAVVSRAVMKQDINEPLVQMFWAARRDVLSWIAEQEIKEKDGSVSNT
jgi:hypothetical protein